MSDLLSGWGRNQVLKCNLKKPKNLDQLKNITRGKLIARGLGRSYGDSSLQKNCTVITSKLNKILYFDKTKGIIETESGISIKEILQHIIPCGWFLKVTPGSKFITVGGMVASDVHGKNHHKFGSFRHQIIELKVLNENNKILTCNKKKNKDLFNYTIGGMGLTGIVYSCRFKLLKIKSNLMYQQKIKNKNIHETIKSLKESSKWTYNVAWIDTSARGKNIGRSILFRAEHSKEKNLKKLDSTFLKNKRINFKNIFPNWIINSFVINIMNKIYFYLSFNKKSLIDINEYFYQLDKINNWNLIYGSKGFISYQFVIPFRNSTNTILKILHLLNKKKIYSFVSVIKILGKKDGFLSFGIKGFTLVFDFPISKDIYKTLEKIDDIIIKSKGNIYLCKDSRISVNKFSKMKSSFHSFKFLKLRKKMSRFSSKQSERLKI
jgi:hypothetical protein